MLCRPEVDGLWAVSAGQFVLVQRGGDVGVRYPKRDTRGYTAAAAAAPDGTRVCIGSNDYDGSSLEQLALPECDKVWRRRPRFDDRVTSLAYSDDGLHIGCGVNTGGVTVFDARTGLATARLLGAESEVKAVALSRDGRYVAWCAGTQLHLWRLAPQEQILRHRMGRTHFFGAAFHPSGAFLATTNGDGKVDYWGTAGGRRGSFDWGVGKVNAIAFDATGDRAACAAESGQVVVWDVDR